MLLISSRSMRYLLEVYRVANQIEVDDLGGVINQHIAEKQNEIERRQNILCIALEMSESRRECRRIDADSV